MSIRWITPILGTGPFAAVEGANDLTILDVRDLVDKAGNSPQEIQRKIREGVDWLRAGKRVVVCCDYGMSRSNAIAAGILCSFDNRSFDDSVRHVLKTTGESQIKIEPLMAVRAALDSRSGNMSASQQRCILLTGGGGFLGQALQATLADEFRIIAPSRTEIDIVSGNTNLDLLVDEIAPCYIIHFANPRVYTSNIAVGQMLTMLSNVLDVCIARDIKLIYPSGWEIYTGYAGALYAQEYTPPLPRGPYGEAKYLAEALIEHRIRTAGLRCALLRSSPVYGKGSDRPKFIYNFIEKALQAKPIVTHRYINGEPALDLLHVEDFIDAVVSVLRTGFVGALNLGTGTLTSTHQIAHMIVDRLNSASSVRHSAIETHVANVAMDSHCALKALNWIPKISFEAGLDRILANILNKQG